MSCATVSFDDMLARSGGRRGRRRRRTICIPHKRPLSGSESLHRDMGYTAPEFAAACHGLMSALVIALLRCYAFLVQFDKCGVLKAEPTPTDAPQAPCATFMLFRDLLHYDRYAGASRWMSARETDDHNRMHNHEV